MKNVMIFAVAVLLTVGFASCKKDYNCACTFDFGGSDTTVIYTYEDMKESDATETCQTQEDLYKIGDPNASCSLSKQ